MLSVLQMLPVWHYNASKKRDDHLKIFDMNNGNTSCPSREKNEKSSLLTPSGYLNLPTIFRTSISLSNASERREPMPASGDHINIQP